MRRSLVKDVDSRADTNNRLTERELYSQWEAKYEQKQRMAETQTKKSLN